MHRRSVQAFVYFIIALASPLALAQSAPTPTRTVPTVIYDAGGVSIGRLLQYVTPDKSQRYRQPEVSPPQAVHVFPVVTTKAKPGVLGPPIKGKLPGGPGLPICVIGDDQLSRHWLSLNLTALENMQARCMVVSVRDEAAFKRLRELTGKLPLMPASLDAVATAAGIPVWPVLISPEGQISQ